MGGRSEDGDVGARSEAREVKVGVVAAATASERNAGRRRREEECDRDRSWWWCGWVVESEVRCGGAGRSAGVDDENEV